MVKDDALDTTPDPVAERAEKFALAVTQDRPKKHPVLRALSYVIITLVVIVGTFGAVTGIINSIQLKEQNATLKKEQACQTVLLDTITREQKARAAIAADDRSATQQYNKAFLEAKTQSERKTAYTLYEKTLAANEERRKNFPVPTFSDTVCKLTRGEAQKLGVIPSDSASVTASKTATPTPTPTSSQSQSAVLPTSTSVPTQSRRSVSVSSAANPQPNSTRTVTRNNRQPGTTTTRTQQVSVPVASPTPGLLNLPGCTISLLGIKVC